MSNGKLRLCKPQNSFRNTFVISSWKEMSCLKKNLHVLPSFLPQIHKRTCFRRWESFKSSINICDWGRIHCSLSYIPTLFFSLCLLHIPLHWLFTEIPEVQSHKSRGPYSHSVSREWCPAARQGRSFPKAGPSGPSLPLVVWWAQLLLL